MQVVVGIAYLSLGLFQWAAIFAGMAEWTGLHCFVSSVLALFLAYIPLLGTVVGIFGAMSGWGWSGLQAAGLFFGPMAVILVIVFVAAGVESVSTARR